MSFHLKLSSDCTMPQRKPYDVSVRPQSRHIRLDQLRAYAPVVSKGQMVETLLVAALIIVASLGLACAI